MDIDVLFGADFFLAEKGEDFAEIEELPVNVADDDDGVGDWDDVGLVFYV